MKVICLTLQRLRVDFCGQAYCFSKMTVESICFEKIYSIHPRISFKFIRFCILKKYIDLEYKCWTPFSCAGAMTCAIMQLF